MSGFNNIDCRTLSFSPELSSKRLSKAQLIFGEKVIKRIICFCLYILGVRRIEISEAVKLPENTVRTMLKAISRDGFAAFFDRRKKEKNRIGNHSDKPGPFLFMRPGGPTLLNHTTKIIKNKLRNLSQNRLNKIR